MQDATSASTSSTKPPAALAHSPITATGSGSKLPDLAGSRYATRSTKLHSVSTSQVCCISARNTNDALTDVSANW
jgi:hypothetical protein